MIVALFIVAQAMLMLLEQIDSLRAERHVDVDADAEAARLEGCRDEGARGCWPPAGWRSASCWRRRSSC